MKLSLSLGNFPPSLVPVAGGLNQTVAAEINQLLKAAFIELMPALSVPPAGFEVWIMGVVNSTDRRALSSTLPLYVGVKFFAEVLNNEPFKAMQMFQVAILAAAGPPDLAANSTRSISLKGGTKAAFAKIVDHAIQVYRTAKPSGQPSSVPSWRPSRGLVDSSAFSNHVYIAVGASFGGLIFFGATILLCYYVRRSVLTKQRVLFIGEDEISGLVHQGSGYGADLMGVLPSSSPIATRVQPSFLARLLGHGPVRGRRGSSVQPASDAASDLWDPPLKSIEKDGDMAAGSSTRTRPRSTLMSYVLDAIGSSSISPFDSDGSSFLGSLGENSRDSGTGTRPTTPEEEDAHLHRVGMEALEEQWSQHMLEARRMLGELGDWRHGSLEELNLGENSPDDNSLHNRGRSLDSISDEGLYSGDEYSVSSYDNDDEDEEYIGIGRRRNNKSADWAIALPSTRRL